MVPSWGRAGKGETLCLTVGDSEELIHGRDEREACRDTDDGARVDGCRRGDGGCKGGACLEDDLGSHDVQLQRILKFDRIRECGGRGVSSHLYMCWQIKPCGGRISQSPFPAMRGIRDHHFPKRQNHGRRI